MAAETKKATADLSAKMRTQKLRTAIAAAVFAVMAAGLILGVSTGTMSGFGWESISALCPLGVVPQHADHPSAGVPAHPSEAPQAGR